MTFTYSSTALSTDLAKVRLKLGDTKEAHALLTDEQIAALLTEHTTVEAAAVAGCKRILALLTRDVDSNAGGITNTRSQKTTHYKDLLALLEDDLRASGEPYVGGVSKADKIDREADTDFVRPAFGVGMDDYT